jgi:glutamate N-acetyltransferase/amino-acid N-acetyltransferase
MTADAPQLDPTGTATSAIGFSAGAVYAGIKTYGEGKLDVAILASDRPATVAGMFTKARLHAPAVDIDRERVAGGIARAVVVNAGVANASTGPRGRADGLRMTELTAARLGVDPAHVLVCSTGVIGHFLPMDKIAGAIARITLDSASGQDFARAIMTTDTRPKHAAVRIGPYTIGGCAKGAGMIHPNMATMLAFLTTDAPVERSFLQDVLRQAVDRSFNRVSIDGDTSPSDTVLLFANGAAGGDIITAGSAMAPAFAAALETLCVHLAKAIARDGEGATRLVEFTVTGAANDADARHLVSLLSTSYLLKSAIHGADPNWGRIIAVIGRSEAAYNEDDVAVAICGRRVFEHLRPTEFDPAAVSESLKGDTVVIEVSLGAGPGSATGWTCDLSEEYVTINADYHT